MIKEIKVEDTYPIRIKVLRDGINLPYKFDGDFEDDTFHLGVYKENLLIGIASFMKKGSLLIDSKSQYQLRGMAIIENVRGLGFGKQLLDEANIILRQKNINFLWCNARENAIKFYEANEFKVIGSPFNINKIGKHYLMYKKIPN